MTHCIGAGGAAWGPFAPTQPVAAPIRVPSSWRSGVRTAESMGLQRRHGNGRVLARLGLRVGEKGEHVRVMRRRDPSCSLFSPWRSFAVRVVPSGRSGGAQRDLLAHRGARADDPLQLEWVARSGAPR